MNMSGKTKNNENPQISQPQTSRLRDSSTDHSTAFYSTGLFKNKYTLSKIYFTRTTDAKSMSCVQTERKSLKVLISIIWSSASLRLWLLLPVTCCDECGKAGLSIWHLPRHTWGSHRVLVRCESNFEISPFSLYIARRHMFNSTYKIHFWKCILLFE
jgi:hypothetical protein